MQSERREIAHMNRQQQKVQEACVRLKCVWSFVACRHDFQGAEYMLERDSTADGQDSTERRSKSPTRISVGRKIC